MFRYGYPHLPAAYVATLLLIASLVSSGCHQAASEEKAAAKSDAEKPAKIEKLPVETDLATITLTADADRRLGITTSAVTEREITQRRTLGGQAVVPSGKSIIVSAPLAGTVSGADGKPLPFPGSKVQLGQPLLSLKPLLSAERDVPTPAEQVQLISAQANLMAAQTIAAGDVDRSQAEVNGAQIALDRAKQLFADRAGSRRAVDDAEAQLNIATSTLEAAKDRNKQLIDLQKSLEFKSPEAAATAMSVTTPISGLVNRIDVSEAQTVTAGAVLFEIVNLDTIWIRVSVYVDLLRDIQSEQDAQLVSLSGDPLSEPIVAKPIAAPPTADALSSSADVYYEVDNRQIGLRPGQRIGVELAMSKTQTSRIVPAAALIYDIYGNAWVYVETGPRQYTRHRVAVQFVAADEAVLAKGPAVGTPVVVDGAAELFGTEFGAGK